MFAKESVVKIGTLSTKRRLIMICFFLAGVSALIIPFGVRELKAQRTKGITGSWEVSCWNSRGMVIEFTGRGENISGRIRVLGRGGTFGYSRGDEIFKLKEDGSRWTGQFLWRSTCGTKIWQHITFVMKKDRLHGTTANEHCYEYMKRAN